MTLAERFWSKVRRGEGCWLWTAYRTPKGYGVMRVERRTTQVHRLAWEFANGPVPPGMCVCHRCDNPPCVNPAHLFLGTQTDNVADMYRKGRQASKLTAERAREVRLLKAAGVSANDIAERFRISPKTVYHVAAGTAWKAVQS